MKYKVKFTTRFKKDLKLAKKQNKNLNSLFEIIEILANGEKLPEKNKDHVLKNAGGDIHDCHVEPDWILLYEYVDDILVLLLHRVGSHSLLGL